MLKQCSLVDCDKRAFCRGLCTTHYGRWHRSHLTLGACTIDQCPHPAEARGLCNRHVLRLRRHGSPTGGRAPVALTIEERFWEKVEITEACWYWRGSTHKLGYGQFRTSRQRTEYVHVVAYQWLVGPVPEGMELDHLCFHRACVNPDHLEPVTHAVNVQRSVYRSKRAASV